ncbi:MAG: hypothetical protein HDS68_08425 [Bacteroidales bacterium]|nr:hypothetical protein [Bacteroidales bacterium]
MKPAIKIPIFACIITLMSACNHDIFLDGPELPDYTYATVAGDGGTTSFEISTAGLTHITFDLFSDYSKYCTYYDRNGREIASDSPASELGSIVFENQYIGYELIKHGNKITFISIENSSSENHISIRLEYDYTVKFIEIDIERGKKLELIAVEYGELKINDAAETYTQWFSYENDGPVSQIFYWYPYIRYQASTLVESPDQWIRGDFVTLSLPVYIDGEWKLMESESIRIGTRRTTYRPDYKTPVPIEVPPYSSITLASDVLYSRCQIEGVMTFRNPVSKRQHTARFQCDALYPAANEIRIEDAD